jgi:nicotinamide riboside transporter PnuC
MKEYEYIGVMCSIVAYCLIVSGNYAIGFTIGIIASSSLLIYFTTIKSLPSLGLQVFFVCANMYGLQLIG